MSGLMPIEPMALFIASSLPESNIDSFASRAVEWLDDFQLFSPRMNDKLSTLQLFVRVAHTSSFTKAGRELGLSQPSASRRISELEEEVGAALFVRSTRAVKLTEAGTDYLARVEAILSALNEADDAARGTTELRGHLRVALSTSFGVREVIPRIGRFMSAHPALHVDLRMADDRQDLIVEGVDVAFRFGPLKDSNATSTMLGRCPRILVASPDYLANTGMPVEPGDLADHSFVMGPPGAGVRGWTFEKGGRRVMVRGQGRLTISLNEATTAAAVAGLGILATGSWGCRAELCDGQLIRLLPDWTVEPIEVNAVYPAARAARPAARALVAYLADELKAISV
ncbi:LysR family transcriptional regulator [Paraburkholderia sp. GAS42]|jgi:DNA-binding transcriptional LysR family regulator|uniref:LysR family transcriptional regulator n=1 Tax=Paraburkholderia sp. GAS42 TaxID=3035135 RepID=UPI003D2126B7